MSYPMVRLSMCLENRQAEYVFRALSSKGVHPIPTLPPSLPHSTPSTHTYTCEKKKNSTLMNVSRIWKWKNPERIHINFSTSNLCDISRNNIYSALHGEKGHKKRYIFHFTVLRVLNFILIYPLKLYCVYCVFHRRWHLIVYCRM